MEFCNTHYQKHVKPAGQGARRKDGNYKYGAQHNGKILRAVPGHELDEATGTYSLMKPLYDVGVMRYEDWEALGHNLRHLNWDINRGWIELID